MHEVDLSRGRLSASGPSHPRMAWIRDWPRKTPIDIPLQPLCVGRPHARSRRLRSSAQPDPDDAGRPHHGNSFVAVVFRSHLLPTLRSHVALISWIQQFLCGALVPVASQFCVPTRYVIALLLGTSTALGPVEVQLHGSLFSYVQTLVYSREHCQPKAIAIHNLFQ